MIRTEDHGAEWEEKLHTLSLIYLVVYLQGAAPP